MEPAQLMPQPDDKSRRVKKRGATEAAEGLGTGPAVPLAARGPGAGASPRLGPRHVLMRTNHGITTLVHPDSVGVAKGWGWWVCEDADS